MTSYNVVRGTMHFGKKCRSALWLNAMHSGKKWWIQEFALPFYCCAASVASEQQHNQDLKRIFITSNQNALHFLPECTTPLFTRVHCASNNTKMSSRILAWIPVRNFNWFTCKSMWRRSWLTFANLAFLFFKMQFVKVCKSWRLFVTSYFKLSMSFLSSVASVVEFLNQMKRNRRVVTKTCRIIKTTGNCTTHDLFLFIRTWILTSVLASSLFRWEWCAACNVPSKNSFKWRYTEMSRKIRKWLNFQNEKHSTENSGGKFSNIWVYPVFAKITLFSGDSIK